MKMSNTILTVNNIKDLPMDEILQAAIEGNLLDYLKELPGSELEEAVDKIQKELQSPGGRILSIKSEDGLDLMAGPGLMITDTGKFRTITSTTLADCQEVSGGTGITMAEGTDTMTISEKGTFFNNKPNGKGTLEKTINYKKLSAPERAIAVRAVDDINLRGSSEMVLLSADEDANALKKGKPLTPDSYIPKSEDMEKINAISKIALTEEQVRVFTFAAANDQVDRGFEHFSKQALKQMAELAVKNRIPFIAEGDYDHQWRSKNVYGVVYDASVKNGKLLYKVFIPVIDRTKSVLEAIYHGLVQKLSVGFGLNYEDFICDSCDKSMFYSDCTHWPGMEDEKGNIVTATIKSVNDNYEISAVAVPMQPEAAIEGKVFATNTKAVTDGFNRDVKTEIESGGLIKQYSIPASGGGRGVVIMTTAGSLSVGGTIKAGKDPSSTIDTESTIGNSVPMDENQVVESQDEATKAEDEAAPAPEAPANDESPVVAPAESAPEAPAAPEVETEKAQAVVSVEFPQEMKDFFASFLKVQQDGFEALNQKLDSIKAPAKGLRDEFAKELKEEDKVPVLKRNAWTVEATGLQPTNQNDLGGQ